MTSNEKVMKYLKQKYPLEKNTPDKPTTIIFLDGQHINHITDDVKKYLENFKDLEELTLTMCNISSLKNFPDLPKLSKIELSDNHIKGEELPNLCKYNNLTELRIANNNIKNFDEIICLEKLSGLTNIDFTECPITKMEKYREKLFEIFKKLKILDGMDKDGKVHEDDDDDDEEDELDEEDKEFIDDEKKEGDENAEEEEEGEDAGEDDNEEEEEFEEKGKGKDNKGDREEIENPNPSKKRKLE